MNDFSFVALRYEHQRFLILDQTQLPQREVWLVCRTPEQLIRFLQRLSLRGAPLIGIAAAVSLAIYAESGVGEALYREAAEKLRAARPTAVNLMKAIDRLLPPESPYAPEEISHRAWSIVQEELSMAKAMSRFGAEVIQDRENLLTHCNTGSLATIGPGTALGCIKEASRQKKVLHVFVDETRPLLQGARLTAWELEEAEIPHTLICDNMAGALMQAGKVQRILVGADRIALNGDVANKIGTYTLAVLAKHNGIPFHVVAPTSTFDLSCPSGTEIPIEQRSPDEVRGWQGHLWAPSRTNTYNPAFDVTPAELVTSYITDQQVLTPKELLEKQAIASI